MKESLINCPVCGLSYVMPIDRREHKRTHEKHLIATDCFDGYVNYSVCEEIKRQAYSVIHAREQQTVEDCVEAFLKLLQAYFSRSLREHNFSMTHPSFEAFAAEQLPLERYQEYAGLNKQNQAAYTRLVEKYGQPVGKASARGN